MKTRPAANIPQSRTTEPMQTSLPAAHLLKKQSEQLAHVRSRMLRKILIGHKEQILDLGAGCGHVTEELKRRSEGRVIALDRTCEGLQSISGQGQPGVHALCGLGEKLPFRSHSFDLVFSQFALFWMDYLQVLEEVHRVLKPGGHLVLIEPDYGGMMEYPESILTKHLWQRGLRRAGADPQLGRKLPTLLSVQGFRVSVELINQLQPAQPDRIAYLEDLPLTPSESAQLNEIKTLAAQQTESSWTQFAYLPILLITATKP